MGCCFLDRVTVVTSCLGFHFPVCLFFVFQQKKQTKKKNLVCQKKENGIMVILSQGDGISLFLAEHPSSHCGERRLIRDTFDLVHFINYPRWPVSL